MIPAFNDYHLEPNHEMRGTPVHRTWLAANEIAGVSNILSKD